MKILNVLEEEKKKCFKIHPHIYLAVLGVSQNNQKRGFGAKMMRALLEEAEKKGLPIYFETGTEGNVRFYEKCGFEVIKEITLPDCNLSMWYIVSKKYRSD